MPFSPVLYAEDVRVGDELPALEKHPSAVQLFRFSAVTWNPHRIHFDREYAQHEGYPDVLVQSHLHGCFLVQTLQEWMGLHGRLRRFRWQNRQFAVAGDDLRCGGVVTAVDGCLVHCELVETNQRGEICAPAWATVELPSRTGALA